MKRQLSLLLLTGLATLSLKSMKDTEINAMRAQLMIYAEIRCTNFRSPMKTTIHISPNATVGALRTTLANILQNPASCEPNCGGMKHCPKATFKNAVNKAGTPVIIKNAGEFWHDNDTVETALKRNNRNSQQVIDFVLNEPKV
jgi:hypothetical protein